VDTRSASLSNQGRRNNNEDSIAYFEPVISAELKNYGCLYIVADGVGGAAHGKPASEYAARKGLYDYYPTYDPNDPDAFAQSISIAIEPLECLCSILKNINEDIYDYASRNDMRMATTIVAAVVREGILYVANVGDSRAYLIREGLATQINRDHSLVGEMVRYGEMTEIQAMESDLKNRLTRSLGGDPDVAVEVYPPRQLQNGDLILLCTDGLTRYASVEDIARMTLMGNPEEISKRLEQFAMDCGGADNVSVVVVAYQPNWTLEPPTTPIGRPQNVDLLDTEESKYQKTTTVHKNNRSLLIFRSLRNRKWRAMIIMFVIFCLGSAITVVGNIMSPVVTPPPATISAASPVITGTQTLSPTEIPPSAPPSDAFWCVYKVQSSDENFQSIINKFPSYNNSSEIYYCILLEDNICPQKILLKPPYTINSSMSIIFKDINHSDTCEKGGGKWIPSS
jgi:PPM family protein phosphatase